MRGSVVRAEPAARISSQIRDRIGKHMAAAGYTASPKSKQYHALDSFVYEYQNAGGMRDNLKVEINYMLRCHVLDVDKRRIQIPWLAQDTVITTVHPVEIYGSKITALINRNAPRDLPDVLARVAHHPMAIWKCEARDAQPSL